ncbi:MAG: HlyD family efflux transporter periplasmic adaptor subunit [Algicola sp.]|nr:HlyD family efflux transporter periplasmic adaptor subunit [Algicola sp.]
MLKMMRTNKKVLLALVITVLTAVYVLSIDDYYVVEYDSLWIDKVESGDLEQVVLGLGKLKAKTTVFVTVSQKGIVREINVQPGSLVHKGDILYRLSDDEIENRLIEVEHDLAYAHAELYELKLSSKHDQISRNAALNKAEVTYEMAQLEAGANKELFDKGTVSQFTYKVAELKVKEARDNYESLNATIASMAQLYKARETLVQSKVKRAEQKYNNVLSQKNNLQVLAPIDGTVENVDVQLGELATLGKVLSRISDLTDMEAHLDIAQAQISQVKQGLMVELKSNAGTVKGVVKLVEPLVKNGFAKAIVALSEQQLDWLIPDLDLEASITTNSLKAVNYLRIPAKVVSNRTQFVYKVDKNKQFARRIEVKFGDKNLKYIQVVNGLSVNDAVILSSTKAFETQEIIKLVK